MPTLRYEAADDADQRHRQKTHIRQCAASKRHQHSESGIQTGLLNFLSNTNTATLPQGSFRFHLVLQKRTEDKHRGCTHICAQEAMENWRWLHEFDFHANKTGRGSAYFEAFRCFSSPGPVPQLHPSCCAAAPCPLSHHTLGYSGHASRRSIDQEFRSVDRRLTQRLNGYCMPTPFSTRT